MRIIKKHSGRNNTGRITMRHKGGGHKRKFRQINSNSEWSSRTFIKTIYDPNRNNQVNLNSLPNGKLINISTTNSNLEALKRFDAGKVVYNIDNRFAKSSMEGVTILKHETGNRTLIQMPSMKKVLVSSNYTASTIPSIFVKSKSWTKAGQSRWRGIRPTVRGETMNPVDHPHGGNSSCGRKGPRTKWGKLA